MNGPPTALERAFELARSGECRTVTDVRARLKREGYSPHVLVGRTLTGQIARLCRAATGELGGHETAQRDASI